MFCRRIGELVNESPPGDAAGCQGSRGGSLTESLCWVHRARWSWTCFPTSTPAGSHRSSWKILGDPVVDPCSRSRELPKTEWMACVRKGLAWHLPEVRTPKKGLRFQFGFSLASPSTTQKGLPKTNMKVQEGQLTKRKVVFLEGSVHFRFFRWWEGKKLPWAPNEKTQNSGGSPKPPSFGG